MRPLQISAETAQKLAQALDVPIEQVMHLPQHILIQKLVEIERKEADESKK
ncbi:YycC family protein [Sutcliffiella horikoshii]|uniref:YycC family protein n=1 Tax=Sutcliffiella horikoshii TaxID=79883 RepID=UPI00204066E6|nr:YycC family protein [Sutcliffiella horikoshii]MCM3617615.1 YycC family protein [Sutcliffiella horikoshii]